MVGRFLHEEASLPRTMTMVKFRGVDRYVLEERLAQQRAEVPSRVGLALGPPLVVAVLLCAKRTWQQAPAFLAPLLAVALIGAWILVRDMVAWQHHRARTKRIASLV